MKHPIILLSLLTGLVSCSAADDAADTTATTTTPAGDSSLSEVSDVGSLKLSSLSIELPAALTGGGSSLRLAAAKKSSDACQMGDTISQVTSRLSQVGSFACHIEVEKDKITFGKKIKITNQGQEFGRLMVSKDNDKITFAMCQDSDERKSKQLITVTKVADSGPAGSIYESGTYTYDGQEQSFISKSTFDMTAAGVIEILGADKYSTTGNSFMRTVNLTLKESGVSVAALASQGTWNGQEFSQRGAAKFDGEHGNTLFQSKGSSTYNGQTFNFDFANRSYFDADGNIVNADDFEAFAAPSGALYIAKSDVPDYITDESALGKAEGWIATDCADIDETVDLNPESKAHAACDGDHGGEGSNCWDEASFERGVETNDMK